MLCRRRRFSKLLLAAALGYSFDRTGGPLRICPAATASDQSLSVEVQTLLRCSELCNQDQGPSVEDEKLAQRMKTTATKVCHSRCRRNDKTAEELSSVPPLAEYRELPAELLQYRRAANACAVSGPRPWEDLLRGLDMCGVAHLDGQLLPSALFSEMQSAYRSLRSDSSDTTLRLDATQLRAGREEMWLPFRWPFNASAVISMPKLMHVVTQYLGPNATFDHITVLDAPATVATQDQDLHSDVSHMRQHLEVHMPLTDVSAAMGATLFCPASQGLSEVDDLRRAYFIFANCSHDPELSYKQPLRAGQVTIYDGNVFHLGSANRADVNRPVLAMSWAADVALVNSRKYAQRTFAKNLTRWQLMQVDIDAFRGLWRQEL